MFKKFFSNKFLLAVIFITALSALTRFVFLNRVPASLYYDEIDLGYQVRSLLQTGKDYRGHSSLLYFRSFNTDKTPLPIYFSLVPSLFFHSPEYQVRAGAALAGVLVVVFSMLIVYQLTANKTSIIITGLVFAFSPWLIHFSRLAFEAIFMLLVAMTALWFFYHYLNTGKRWAYYLSAFFIGLSVYTYRPMSLFAPMLALTIAVIYRRQFINLGIKASLVWLTIIAFIATPFLYATTIGSKDQPRINQISIFSNPETPIFVQRNREIDSQDFTNPQIGKRAVTSSFLFHNKAVSYFQSFIRNYFQSFSTQFLFLSGDPNNRHNIKDSGELLTIDILGLIFGLIFLFKNIRQQRYQLIAALLLLSPIPSNITNDGGSHASRLMLFALPLLITTSLGYFYLTSIILTRKRGYLATVVLFIVWTINISFFLHRYFVHYPIESAREFGYGYSQALEKIAKLQKDFTEFRLTAKNDPPMLYYFYFMNIPAREIQQYGSDYSASVIKGLPLDHTKPVSFEGLLCDPQEIAKLRTDTLYLVSFKDLPLDFRTPDKDTIPQGIKLLDIVKYPDNEVAYYLITRASQSSKPVQPTKSTSCK